MISLFPDRFSTDKFENNDNSFGRFDIKFSEISNTVSDGNMALIAE